MRPPLMIFAAGLGTRMRPLTDHLPKPLIPVAGTTLLDRALKLGRDAGIETIAVNTHYLGEMVVRHLQGSDVRISPEADVPLETGGGLRKALPLLQGNPVLTLNPDVVWTGPNPLRALCEQWRDDMDALLMLIPLERATGRVIAGDFSINPQGQITRKGDFAYAGAQLLRTDRLAEIPDQIFSLNKLWDMLIAQGRAYGTIHPGGWCDIGRPETIALAEGLLADDRV